MKKNIHSLGNDPGGGGSTHSASHPGRSWAPPCRGCRTACSAESAYVKVRTSSSRLHLEPTSNLCTNNILFSRTCNREASALPPQNQPPNTGHLAACGFFTSSGKDIFCDVKVAAFFKVNLRELIHSFTQQPRLLRIAPCSSLSRTPPCSRKRPRPPGCSTAESFTLFCRAPHRIPKQLPWRRGQKEERASVRGLFMQYCALCCWAACGAAHS